MLWAATAVTLAATDESGQDHFQRGYYLQNHAHDAAGAIAAYEKALSAPGMSESLRAAATVRLQQCREDLHAADLAQLMPADALAYAEIGQLGQNLERLARLLGLLRDPATIHDADPPSGVSLGDSAFLPDDLALSPALMAELEKVRGVAAAVTSVDPPGPPQGVVVIHPGDSDLLRGLIETGIQFLPPGEPVEDYPTYRVENELWVALTHRLVILSPSRDEIVASIARLHDPAAESLANETGFARLNDQRRDALAFAYVAGPSIVQALDRQTPSRETAMARAVLDLDHLRNVSATLRATETNVQLQLKLNLDQGHRNLLYGLVQTSSITRDSLQWVPSGSAAVAVLGLNPPAPAPARSDSATLPFSLMDIGRELFSNIVEASLFVLPERVENQSRPPLPEIGLVLAVRDANQSEALWNQLLSLPALLGAPQVSMPRDVTIEGQPARQIQLPEAPPLLLMKREGGAIVVGTPGAVSAVVATTSASQSIASDARFQSAIETLTPFSSKAIFVDAARVLEAVTAVEPHAARDLAVVQPLVGELAVMVVTDEAPNSLTLRAEVSGLPDVPEIVKQIARNGQFGRRQLSVTQTHKK
jgi:hypothetical protein